MSSSPRICPAYQSVNLPTMPNTNERISLLPLLERKIKIKADKSTSKYSNLVLFEEHYKNRLAGISQTKTPKIYITESSVISPKTTEDETQSDHHRTHTQSIDVQVYQPILPKENGESYLDKLAKKQRFHLQKGDFSAKSESLLPKHIDKNKPFSTRDFIIKTREINKMKYSLDMKKERALRISEYYCNELESIDMTMKSMEEARKLFDEDFCVKLSEYIKKLNIDLDKERVIAYTFLQKVMAYKKDITQLEMRIAKKNNEKEAIVRWVTFQKDVYKLNSSHKEIQEEIHEKVNGQVPLIYESPEEFISIIHNGEKNSRFLLENYNAINDSIDRLINEKDQIEEYYQESTAEERKLIAEKEIILEKLQKRNQDLLSEHRIVVGLNKGLQSREYKIKVRASIIQMKAQPNTQLKKKITDLYNITKGLFNDEFPDEVLAKNKVNWSFEKEMMFKLTYIERGINLIQKHFEYYDCHPEIYGPLLRNIHINIELQHKALSSKKAKEEELFRMAVLKEKIEERNKKVYFLPIRKVDVYQKHIIESNKRKNTKVISKPKELGLEDFMYDIDD